MVSSWASWGVCGHAPPENFRNLDTPITFLMHSDIYLFLGLILIRLTMRIIMINIIYTSSVKCQLSTELNWMYLGSSSV